MKRLIRIIVAISVLVALVATAAGLLVGMYYYIRMTRDLPQIEKLSDYRPRAVSFMYGSDGSKIAELYEPGGRRYPVTNINQIPQMVRNAFLAAEDVDFYKHPGIDFISIVRAFWVNLRSARKRQGASTITQQVVKSLLLSRERTYERKVKEAILSYQLEKALSKDDIFLIYLNEIFLGSGSYGIKAAARVHFHKEMNELSISEAAFLAGLPQRPSQLTNAEHRREAIERREYVLNQMLRHQMITQKEHDDAKAEEVKILPPDEQNIYATPYFAGHAIKLARDIMHNIDPSLTPEDPGGFEIQTTVDPAAYVLAEHSLQRALKEIDKRQGWRGPLNRRDEGIKGVQTQKVEVTASDLKAGDPLFKDELYRAQITKINPATGIATVQLGEITGEVNIKAATWAKALKKGDAVNGIVPEKYVRVGDIIEVAPLEPTDDPSQTPKPEGSADAKTADGKEDAKKGADKAEAEDTKVVRFKLDATPEVEGAMSVHNALTGEVKAIIGGFDYRKSNFNRATQGELQPGSAFKPLIYLAALEELHYTPSTIVPDSPISLPAGNGEIWSPQNYDHEYLGPITLRLALERSRNVVSVYLLTRMGIDRAIESARKLGITTPIQRNLSIALGTPEVHLIELVHAYGAFAAEGWLADMLIIKSIKDRDGKIIYEQKPKQKKVIADDDAFIMANMMRGVVESGTATLLKQLKRPIAGKTGTTNDQMDAWFIGYTPEWVLGVWVGYDVKRSLGRMETGGKAAAPAVLYFLQEFLKDAPEVDFNIPNGVIPVTVNRNSGTLASPGDEGSILEYFKNGTEPRAGRQEVEIPQQYLSNDEF